MIDNVHDDAQNQDARRRDNPLPKTSAPPSESPERLGSTPRHRACVPSRASLKSVAKRGDDRHRRLQDEAKGHRAAGPIKNVAPETAETFLGNPIPGHAKSDEANQKQQRDAREENRTFRGGTSVKAQTLGDSVRFTRKVLASFAVRIASMLTVIARIGVDSLCPVACQSRLARRLCLANSVPRQEHSRCLHRLKRRKSLPIATQAIRAFYESHPYPAPVASLERRLDRYRDPQRRRAQSLLLWPLEPPRPDRSILVAGCGTSQAARHALMEPDARVTAIDVSETSLRCTRDLQAQTRHTKFAASPACDRAHRGAWRDVRPDRLHRRASSP